MNTTKAFILSVGMAVVALGARDASACGGCFAAQTESTQVTGHKMILSISKSQTTLYDQITYSGSPASFAWILPIKGVATVGLSSDALFQSLAQKTQVTVASPPLNCPVGGCGLGFSAGAGTSGAGGGAAGGPVTVIAQQVVGPFDTVQLQSTDPNALHDWLTSNGYNIPDDITPVIAAYVAESFDFLALKLEPGQGVSAMRPVRVTTPGASPVLPLRMVAAGTGTITPITLFVLGEGRYDTSNLPSFVINPDQLVWDWDTQSSNYATLKQQGFTQTQNRGWAIEAASPFSGYDVESDLDYLLQYDPQDSGYSDSPTQTAAEELTEDMSTLFSHIPQSSLWITRLEGELSRDALAADLQLTAAVDQTSLTTYLQATKSTGTPPACPPVIPCSEDVSVGTSGGNGGSTSGTGGSVSGGGGGGCAVASRDASGALFGGAALLAALVLSRRRRSSNLR